MCSPQLGMMAVAAGAQYQQAKGQAEFQQSVQDRNSTLNNQQAIRSANASNKALAGRQREREISDADTKARINRDALRSGGTLRQSGTGRSAGATLSDLAQQQSSANARVDRSAAFSEQQAQREAEAIRERARGRSLGQYAVPQPSLALAALNYASSKAVSSYIDKLSIEDD